jgi:hypothetical protein
LDFIWHLAKATLNCINQLDWSVDPHSSVNHPRGYILLKTTEMAEAGLAAQHASKIEPNSILTPGYVNVC